MARDVFIIGEIRDGSIIGEALEATAAAVQIAEGGEVTGGLCGSYPDRVAEEWIRYGVDRVVTLQDNEAVNPNRFVRAVRSEFMRENPDLVIAGHAGYGEELAFRLAESLDLPLVTEVIGITRYLGSLILLQEENWHTLYGDEEEKLIATIQPGRFRVPDQDPEYPGLIEPVGAKELKIRQPV
ncbi:hypothetical protein AV656_07490 [Bhargavaea cecembensis]|uniref:Electron transfer flavoprotein alpha/beta-subunit N-terminal domain-containing protein n=1 Tax=Bhargavaea cecembensis TaxID=394098 RepID=A0A165H494_9BACL|nr:hypothetical protein [Bhargavaea cecembensis]KZE38738.1 hypothetical protein AV656_07490 [Bhargavaea cecembensis]